MLPEISQHYRRWATRIVQSSNFDHCFQEYFLKPYIEKDREAFDKLESNPGLRIANALPFIYHWKEWREIKRVTYRDVSACDWRYQTHVKNYRPGIFSASVINFFLVLPGFYAASKHEMFLP